MRSRNIKPGFFVNEILGQADPILSILFAGLWCLADREGRLEDRPLRIKAEVFPYRESLDIHRCLTELSRLGFIHRYGIGGVRLIQITNFAKHQNPHHTERASTLPPPNIDNTNGCLLTVNSPLEHGGNPPDSLIPDSLIPDSSTPPTPLQGEGVGGGWGEELKLPPKNPPKPRKAKTPPWKEVFPKEIVDTVKTICDEWPNPPEKQPHRPGQEDCYVPRTSGQELAARLQEIQREGGDLDVCKTIARIAIQNWRDGQYISAAQNFFGKKATAPFKAYYQAYITNQQKLQEV